MNESNKDIPLMKFTESSITVITPYNAQKNIIAERFLEFEMDDQVLSIDSSQGREFDIVFVSMVRTFPGDFIKEFNRINVGITRAKHALIIVGNANALKEDERWAHLLQKHNKSVVEGSDGACEWIDQQIKAFTKKH